MQLSQPDRRAAVPPCPALLPEAFADLREVIPSLAVDLRYTGADNFVGEPVDGYQAPRPILTWEAAWALRAVQTELQPFGLGLKIYDAYRPHRATAHFLRWARDLADTRSRAAYHPRVAKADLFKEGYLGERSAHSRGSTVDLTLVRREGPHPGPELDMGTRFDFFDPASWPDSWEVPIQARANRLLLRKVMEGHGFYGMREEWWHFTLVHEPFPEALFDFLVA